MRAGHLRHRATLQTVGGSDVVGDGNPTLTPTTVASDVPVAIEPANASNVERLFAGLSQFVISSLVRCRYRTDVGPTSQWLFGTRILRVRGIQNVGERNRELVMACEELR
ncbi:Bacteriophage SPP1, head-tail adaptor [uncultured Caudovirales phage]|uniref:Bacteriophage SPP1, head-tail adaptor n=1 Tax=uncultured Caudovirales phage TaxID=2100421 RepID=A0A6J5S244_9CAUD|nr:Bacteriophage SPP1, head-tail adaptor [uncultured Caudovirales phage]CAB4199335.1 Bacteriophage SPP1, head-tail adaptor [uncultured Caudovirales phage]CAB4212952.1 Bacteriophage SPP1, head-tail adaptor [uncultured Caudovirales phage]CAB5227978.1 Bacteriophage SPP1, head-tail adaptor [uncultured Caudovirales phage]